MAPVHGEISAAPIVAPPDLKVDGSVRPARLRVLVAQHLRRPNGDACPPSDKTMHR
jgi:hypothetical protein